VVFAIAASGAIAGITAIEKLINQQTSDHLLALALAGAIGMAGNAFAAHVRTKAGASSALPP
jgi:divalent metal cation (Fe/Co/Zn/Cd) transporter